MSMADDARQLLAVETLLQDLQASERTHDLSAVAIALLVARHCLGTQSEAARGVAVAWQSEKDHPWLAVAQIMSVVVGSIDIEAVCVRALQAVQEAVASRDEPEALGAAAGALAALLRAAPPPTGLTPWDLAAEGFLSCAECLARDAATGPFDT